MPDVSHILAGLLAVAYGLTMALLLRRGDERPGIGRRRWLGLALAAAAAGMAIQLLPADAHEQARYEALFVGELTPPVLSVLAASLLMFLFGIHLLHYLQNRWAALWALAGAIWWGALSAISADTANTIVGQDAWLGKVYDPVVWPGVVAVAGWAVIGALLLFAAFYAFYKAHLSEVANQALFGAVILVLVVLGAGLGASGSNYLAEAGWLLQFLGLAGAVYSATVYRVFDIRRALRHAAAWAVLTLLGALVLFGALVVARELDADSTATYAALVALAVAGALVYVPLHSGAQALLSRLLGASTETSAQRLRKFSEGITGVVELDALVDMTMHTLNQVLRVRRGGLILATEEADGVLHIEPVPHGLGEIPEITGDLVHASPICEQLRRQRAPLLQYDLDFGRAYAGARPEEREFFQQMRMSAYAPVIVEGKLIGILCSGAKITDDPYTDADLELLGTLATQVGVALRNARLVADLRRRDAEQSELNKALSMTKEQLEKLDRVKTDFITIASHELRTPLAQIRGYTDIMEAMNEQGLLDQDQTASMTGNLRRAADRLEELIAAMLDVSQLDVNAMDLRFTQTSIEQVMRMAIEPLTEAIQNRKLMLSARGLRNLPPIQADMQRLVQAFRNVVLNAIKYTPDGGRIDIAGRMQDDEVVVSIHDSGIGIDPANHELVFEKFFRAQDPSLHSTGATKFMGAGPGLGLTIARGVVMAHGGRIWVESDGCDMQSMPGSTFFIALPLNPPEIVRRVRPFDSAVSLGTRRTSPRTGGNGPIGAEEATNGAEAEPDVSRTLTRPPAGLRE